MSGKTAVAAGGKKQLSLMAFLKPKAAPAATAAPATAAHAADGKRARSPEEPPKVPQAPPTVPAVVLDATPADVSRALKFSATPAAADPPTPLAPLCFDDKDDSDEDGDNSGGGLTLGDLLARRSSTTTAKAAPQPTTKKPQQQQQTYLDFGQRHIGAEPCAHCGMVFTTAPEDLALHRRHCAAAKAKHQRGRRGAGKASASAASVEALLSGRGAARAWLDGMCGAAAAPHGGGATCRKLPSPSPHFALFLIHVTDGALPIGQWAGAAEPAATHVAVAVGVRTGAALAAAAGRETLREQDPAVSAATGRVERRFTLVDVLRATASAAAAAEELRGGGLVVGRLSQRDQELLGGLIKTDAERFFFGGTAAATKRERPADDDDDEGGKEQGNDATITASTLSREAALSVIATLAANVVYGGRAAVPGQMSFQHVAGDAACAAAVARGLFSAQRASDDDDSDEPVIFTHRGAAATAQAAAATDDGDDREWSSSDEGDLDDLLAPRDESDAEEDDS